MGRRISLSNTILKLEAAIKEVEARFEALKAKGIDLQEKRAELDRAISENVTEMVRVQGENRALVAMLDKEKGSGEPEVIN
jgi:predicted transcriptional regulator